MTQDDYANGSVDTKGGSLVMSDFWINKMKQVEVVVSDSSNGKLSVVKVLKGEVVAANRDSASEMIEMGEKWYM